MAKFIISSEAEIYTTHGPVRANVIYDSYIKNKLNVKKLFFFQRIYKEN